MKNYNLASKGLDNLIPFLPNLRGYVVNSKVNLDFGMLYLKVKDIDEQ